jgi:hypothetical protein
VVLDAYAELFEDDLDKLLGPWAKTTTDHNGS